MTSWSFSHYSLALQCLRKYKYVCIDKLTPNLPDSSDLVFGSALHSAINSVLTGQDGAATFELYWNSYKDKDISYGRFNWKQLAELGSGFIRKFTKYHAGKYKLEFAEQRLYGEYRGVQLEGTLDFFGEYNGKASLRDFKTAGRNYDQEKSVSALQLYLYAYLLQEGKVAGGVKQDRPRIETLGYTVFNKGTGSIQDLTWDFEEAKMYEALDQMVDYVGRLSGGIVVANMYPKNYGACLDYNRKCVYFDVCHKKERT